MTAIRNLMIGAAAGVLSVASAFAATWDQTLRTSHTQLIGALNGDPSTLATITDDGLGIRLGPIVERVKAELIARGAFRTIDCAAFSPARILAGRRLTERNVI